MKYIPVEILLEKVGSLFKLTNMASVRAIELNNGMKRLVDADPKTKNTTVAISEIAAGKVKLK